MNEPLTQVTALIALIVTLITYGQWITNRARLKLELFEKRYAVYEKIAAFLAETLMKGRLIKGNEDKFSRDTKTRTSSMVVTNPLKTWFHRSTVWLVI